MFFYLFISLIFYNIDFQEMLIFLLKYQNQRYNCYGVEKNVNPGF